MLYTIKTPYYIIESGEYAGKYTSFTPALLKRAAIRGK
jgi:hypothetical protein